MKSVSYAVTGFCVAIMFFVNLFFAWFWYNKGVFIMPGMHLSSAITSLICLASTAIRERENCDYKEQGE